MKAVHPSSGMGVAEVSSSCHIIWGDIGRGCSVMSYVLYVLADVGHDSMTPIPMSPIKFFVLTCLPPFCRSLKEVAYFLSHS